MKKENVLGFDVLATNYEMLIKNIFEDISHNKQNFIVNINPLIIMNFYNNQKYMDLFNKEKYQIADGYGTVWASKHRKKLIKERITGIDLMDKICSKASQTGNSIYLCGAKPGVAKKCKLELQRIYPKINIIGECDGYISEDEMIKKINKEKPDILFLALGSPKQEDFIIKCKSLLKDVKVFMPVGGSFDVFAGNIIRAPKFYQKAHLEWLYRMIKEPKRIKRNLSLVKYVFLVLFTNK